MSYQVLARKYRPQNFDQIIGQEHVSQTLSNAITSNRLSSAYLFAGPRGIGKTTTARIFAKALNCLRDDKPTPNPCQKCVNCLEITKGNCVDVIEIDAASNRGIDDIRSLRENIKFAPASCRYKVYIIDEAHQITSEGFNAFLKTMEEPPSHIVFVLATTEQHKIPLTILSRCQRFVFRPIPNKKIVEQLKAIIESEKKSAKNISVDESVFPLIARYSQGSMRDAESLLDQLLSYSSGTIKIDDFVNMLGIIPQDVLTEFAKIILQGDTTAGFEKILQVSETGYNMFQFGKDLRDFLHELMVNRFSGKEIDIIPKEYLQQFNNFTNEQIWRCARLISQAVEEMKWADQPRFVFETYMPMLTKPVIEINEIIAQLDKMESGSDDNDDPEPDYQPTQKPVIENIPSETVTVAPVSPVNTTAPNNETDVSYWQKLLNKIRKEKLVLASYMEQSAPVLKDDVLTLNFPPELKFNLRGVENDRQTIERVLQEIFNKPVRVQCAIQNTPVKPVVVTEPEPDVIEEPEELIVKPPIETEPETPDTEETDDKDNIKDLFASDHNLKKIKKHFTHAELISEHIKPVVKSI